MTAKDGKLRNTDVMDYNKIIQLIQLLPRKSAEAFKAWVGSIAAKHCDLAAQLNINKICAKMGTNELITFKRKFYKNFKGQGIHGSP